MNRILTALAGVLVGAALAYWVVSSQMRQVTVGKLDPSEDPSNAFVPPEKIHPVTADMVTATAKMAHAQAPDFALPSDDGKTYALKDLAAKHPVLLFFIVDSCPCCVTARPYIDRIQATYKDVLTVVGVINADARTAGQWARNNSAKFPLLLDPKLNTIHAYKAKRGTYMALIAPGGAIDKVFPGYSQRLVTDLGARVARLAGIAPRTIEVADLPVKDTTGCEFDMVGKG